MKKIIPFILDCLFGETKMKWIAKFIIIPSFILWILTGIPMLWMGKAYGISLLNKLNPYFFMPFLTLCLLFIFLGSPALYYMGTKYKDKKVAKWIGIFIAFPAGAIYIAMPMIKLLEIPSGPWNLPIVLFSGFIYVLITSFLLKKALTAYYPTSSLV